MGDASEAVGDALYALRERVKELQALHATARLMLRDDLTIEKQLRAVTELLPPAMQFPEISTACIRHGGVVYATAGHSETPWVLSSTFVTADGGQGVVEVAYHQARRAAALGPFLAEERALLASVADMLRAAIDRRHATAALQTLNDRLGLALQAAGMGVWEWNVVDNTISWSEQLSKMLGVEITHGPFGTLEHLVHPEDVEYVRRRLEAAVVGADDLADLSFRFQRPDGGWRHMLARARIERQPGARATRLTAALMDVSERRVLEEGLRQAQKVEALGQLAAGVAHDFKNVLTVLFANTEMVRRKLASGDPSRALVDEIRDGCERGLALTQQLLTFSRKGAFQPVRIRVSEQLARMQPLLARVAKRPAKLHLELDHGVGDIWADAVQLEQVLLNLVVNARDAMPAGGDIYVRTRRERRTSAAGATEYTVIEVQDTGPGIPAEVKDRLFEPFFTTKDPGKGTGLGLAVVSSVARQWQGIVEVDSVPGQGAAFRVLLPSLPR